MRNNNGRLQFAMLLHSCDQRDDNYNNGNDNDEDGGVNALALNRSKDRN